MNGIFPLKPLSLRNSSVVSARRKQQHVPLPGNFVYTTVDSRQKKDQHVIITDGILLSSTMAALTGMLRYVTLAILVVVPGAGTASSLVETAYTAPDKKGTLSSQLSSQLLAAPAAAPSHLAPANEPPADSVSGSDIILLFGVALFVLVGIASWADRPRKTRAFKRGNRPE
jgi:hypothetical protein